MAPLFSRDGSRPCRRGATALVALSLLAAACGGGGGKKAATGQTAGTQPPSEGTPKAGGSLIMGTEAEVDGFDPAKNRWDLTGVTYGLTVLRPPDRVRQGRPEASLPGSVGRPPTRPTTRSSPFPVKF